MTPLAPDSDPRSISFPVANTLTIPLDGLRAAEEERLRAVAATCERNRRIRQRFARLKEEEGARVALRQLADRHNRSQRQIRRIVYDS